MCHLFGSLAPDPRVSAEAKEHAREVLDANASDEYTSGQNEYKDYNEEHNNRVLGGYKATLKSKSASCLSLAIDAFARSKCL